MSRLCHLNLLWIEEAYGMAAASEILRGKSLYSGIWFDKPPLYAAFYTLCQGQMGWPLRILDILWILLCAACAGILARRLWNVDTGILAAALTCLSLTFWIPSAVLAIAPDLLMFVPHVLAVWAIASHRPVLAGSLAGIAMLCNSKALFVLAVILLWDPGQFLRTLMGFILVQGGALLILPGGDYWQQVWAWGARYSEDTFVQNPVKEFVVRTAGWAGFHAAAVIGTGVYLWRTRSLRIALWLLVSLAGVIAGFRFFPRYYFQLLPVVVVVGARGLLLLPAGWRLAVMALLLVPVVRFGPRYVQVAMNGSRGWSDAALMEDSREASRSIGKGTLLVWGYRPDLFVLSGAAAGTRFLDSQPLTGVLADRHLFQSQPTFSELAAKHRQELIAQKPDYIVDGLGPLNRSLAIGEYADLREWLKGYEEIGRTNMSVILRRRALVGE